MSYYSGQGKLFVGKRLGSGLPAPLRYVGNVPELNVSMETKTVEHNESSSGNRILDQILQTGKTAKVSFALEEFTLDNLAMLFYGTKVAKVGAAVAADAEVLPNPVAVGEFLRLKYPKVSDLTIHDSTGSPKSLVADTNYRLNADHGTVEILDLTSGGPFTQPFKAGYTYGDHSYVALHSTGIVEQWLRFEGLNTVDNKKVLIELYRCVINPSKDFPVIQDDLAKFNVDGGALYDASKVNDSELGQFGRVVIL